MVSLQVRVTTPYPEEKVLWVGDFMEDKCQILNLYSRIISIVTIELKVNFTLREETLLADSRIVDPDAYDAYLKGRSYLDGFNPESWYVAVESFEKAFEEMKKNSYVRWEKYGDAELLEEIFYDHGWIAFVQELARTYEEATAIQDILNS